MNEKLNELLGTKGVDFEKPVNFVKLLKLILKTHGWCSSAVIFWGDNTVDVSDVISHSKDKSIEENFMEAILLSVQEDFENCDSLEDSEILLKSLKNNAQQTKWEI